MNRLSLVVVLAALLAPATQAPAIDRWPIAGDPATSDTMRVLLAMPYERRAAHPCIGKDRADLVLPGCAIFEAIRREWPTERVRVADRGLREGILISLIDADRTERAGTAPKRSR